MELRDILVIGAGGCGTAQLSEFMDLDIRVGGLFSNTNLDEMVDLKHFDMDRRCFYIASASGCGKDKELAAKYFKEEASKFAEQIIKFPQKYIIIMSSLDGGSGSTFLTLMPKIIKRYCPNKSINIVGTFNDMSQAEISYENTIDTWNNLLELKAKGIVDSFQFIDNNKGTELDVNKHAMRELMDSFGDELVGNKLDGSDIERVHTCQGYKVMLRLDENIKDVSQAIDKAIKDSYYFMPENYECDIMVGNINTNSHNLNEIKGKFDAFDFVKFNEKTNGDSIVLLGGCEIPKEPIQLTKECLKEVRKRKRERVIKEDLFVKINKDKDDEEVKPSQTKSKLSSKDLKSMFNDDSFWD